MYRFMTEQVSIIYWHDKYFRNDSGKFNDFLMTISLNHYRLDQRISGSVGCLNDA